MLHVVGRMKAGVSIKAAEADLGAVAVGLAGEFPQTNKDRGVSLEGMHDSMIGSDLRLTSMLFLGVVGFVLLISPACLNRFTTDAWLFDSYFRSRLPLGGRDGSTRRSRAIIAPSLRQCPCRSAPASASMR